MAYVQKYYIYDPLVGDDLGGIRIQTDDDGKHILCAPTFAQYWIDQGLMGMQPLSKLPEKQKKMLAQVTRGRSTTPDQLPERVAKYTKLSQSGAPRFSLQPQLQKTKRREDRRKDRTPQPKPAQEPPKSTTVPKPGAAVT